MSVVILLLVVLGVIAGWWLSRQRLMAKPWLEAGPIGDVSGTGASPLPAAKIGLGIFIAVASVLFALFLSAYFMRMELADWRPLPVPTLLWFNTVMLVLSSVALQWARVAVRRDAIESVKGGLLGAGVCSLVFLAGQIVAWRQLTDAGYGLASNPANAFFYMLTAAHALHVIGGLVALSGTADKVWRDARIGQVRLSVELCAAYWHFLLLVWLILFGLLLAGPGNALVEFFARCSTFVLGTR